MEDRDLRDVPCSDVLFMLVNLSLNVDLMQRLPVFLWRHSPALQDEEEPADR